MQVVQTSCAWRRDLTQCLIITFQSFAIGIKVSYRGATSEIYNQNLFTYAKCYEVRVFPDDATNLSQRLKECRKVQTPRRTRNTQSKATKTFHVRQ